MSTTNKVDLHELEKLSPDEELTKALSKLEIDKESKKVSPPEKWQIILEPALVGAMMAINLGQTTLQNFYLRTACTVDLLLPSEVCDKGVGEDFRAAEAASQMVVAGVNISRSFVGSLMATAVLLFVGPWSDCSGRRKPVLILPLVGMCVMTTAVLILVTFPGFSTVQVLYAVQIPMSLGGNFGLMLAAAFCHIGDVCHATGRDVTRTMGTHRAAIQIAHVLGAISGPVLYRCLGFYGVFPIVLLLQLSALIYVIVFMKDVNVNTENKTAVWHWKLPFQAISCLVRRRDGYKRTIIFLMLVVALGDRMLLSAEVLLAFMYYRNKFHWDDVTFGFFLAYRNITSFLGTLVILMLLKRRLRLSDEMIGVLSCASSILASAGLMAATVSFVVFIIPLIGIISQGSQVVQRPILNKQILPTEQGKIYSVLGALESATQTLSSPSYSFLYKQTVTTMPDAWLLPGIILVNIQLLAYLATKKLGQKTNYPEPQVAKPVVVPQTPLDGTFEFGSWMPDNGQTKQEEKVEVQTKSQTNLEEKVT
ncbi:lysosomal proton-coupled steroid conjugate and bile acid symporter SLC46A3-like isoform X1 [Choristoneura fumiferana]|uniref:lysosomal proton-coupled steroid conjugate and bile acid symporter SLC46A3-like isoform X1 n=1 Tax=Choristoneura fumiferana TaxID=7141 RepID=UPI003D157D86